MRYSVSVRFSSSDGRLEVNGDEIAISVKSQPERGRANRELVKKAGGALWRRRRTGQDNFRPNVAEKAG